MSHWSIRAKGTMGSLQLDLQLEGALAPVALIGPNGSGKSTLLRIVSGVLHIPDLEAHITVGSHVLHSTKERLFVSPEQRGIGYVPQESSLFPHLSVLDNTAFGWSTGRHARKPDERRQAALQLLRELKCDELAARLPKSLSGGEQQRVALARALLVEPNLLLLDEPLAALDATRRRFVRQFLSRHLSRTHRPCLMVTHDVRDVAALNAEVCVMERGRIVQRGTLDHLRKAPQNDFVAEFAGQGY